MKTKKTKKVVATPKQQGMKVQTELKAGQFPYSDPVGGGGSTDGDIESFA